MHRPEGPYATVRHGDDWLLRDPVPRVDPEQKAPVQALNKHSYFWSNPEWNTALRALRRIPPSS